MCVWKCVYVYAYVFMIYIVFRYIVCYDCIVLTVFYGKWGALIKLIDDVHRIFSSRFISLCIAEVTIKIHFHSLHTHLLTMEVGDLEACWMAQWSHQGCFKIATGNTPCLCQRIDWALLCPLKPFQSLGSPESKLRRGDLHARS